MNNIIFKRSLEDRILSEIGKKPLLIIFGPRQVGKTTLVKKILKRYTKIKYIQMDGLIEREELENKSVEELVALFSGYELVVFDEAQTSKKIGTILKLLADNIPDVQFIATGSSSFELANKLNEPMTGRNRKFFMFPLSIAELQHSFDLFELKHQLNNLMIYGSYPEVIASDTINEKKKVVRDLSQDYLYKDLFRFGGIKMPEVFEKLVKLLALRIGSEVVFSDVAKELGVSADTVKNYIELLEKAFIIFKLHPMYTNKEKEVSKHYKIYFYDNGIRNAVLDMYDDMESRNDQGMLIENFVMAEFKKVQSEQEESRKMFFWRETSSAEIDLVISDVLHKNNDCYEIKWKKEARLPKAFSNKYASNSFAVINKENVVDFFLKHNFNLV